MMNPTDPALWLRRSALFAAVASMTFAGLACEAEEPYDDDVEEIETDDVELENEGVLFNDATGDGYARAADRVGPLSLVAAQSMGETGTVQSDGELAITKEFPEIVKQGGEFTYALNIANTTDGSLSGVRVTERLPEGVEYVSSSPEPTEVNGRDLVYRMGSMDAGANTAIRVTAIPRTTGDLEACTTYDFEKGVCAPFTVANPSLAITRTVPQMAVVCQPAEITYTVTNDGDTVAEDVMLYEELPEGLMVQEGGAAIEAELGDLQPGQSVERTIVVLGEEAGEYPGSYAVARNELDQASSEKAPFVFVAPSLNVNVSATRDYEYVGKQASFEVVVTNNGEVPSYATIVAIDADAEGVGELRRVGAGEYQQGEAGMEAVEADDGRAFNLGTLEAGQSRNFFVEMDAVGQGEIAVAAVAQSVCTRIDKVLATARDSARISIAPLTALQLEVVDKMDPVKVGQETSYEIAIINEGSGSDRNVRLTGELPEGFEFVSGSGSTNVTNDGRNITFAPVAELPAGQAATWVVVAKVNEASGQTKFTVQANSDELQDETITEDEPTRSY